MTHAARGALLRTLVANDVRFILIGGMAVVAHGHIRATTDVDIVFDTEIGNCRRLASALEHLGADVALADTLPPEGSITAEWLAEGGRFVFGTKSGFLDALSQTSVGTYEDLAPTAIDATLRDGTTARVVSYDNLVRAKEAAGRAKDLADLEELRAIRGEDP